MSATVPTDRILGCILAGCIGDVLGSQAENKTPEVIKRTFPNGRVTLMPRNKRYTDDSEMTIALMEELTSNNFDVSIISVHKRYIEKLANNRGYSQATREVLGQLLPNEFIVNPSNSCHNGALMRIAPLAFGKYCSDQQLYDKVNRAVYYTHGASAEACMVATLHCILLRYLSTCSLNITSKMIMDLLLSKIVHTQIYPKLKIVALLLQQNSRLPQSQITEEIMGYSGFQITAIDCFCCALYNFCSNLDNPKEAMILSASIGGDSDTIAKVTGDMCGALHGQSWIPEEWRGIEDEAYILELANKLSEQ